MRGAAKAASWRTDGFRGFGGWFTRLNPIGPESLSKRDSDDLRMDSAEFGKSVIGLLRQVTDRLLLDVKTRRLPIEPVRTNWKEAPKRLANQLNRMPADVDGDLLANAARPSPRRVIGLLGLLTVELLLFAVLAIAFWRASKQFVLGGATDGTMLLSAAFLATILIFAGHVIANLFFPSLRNRFRYEFARRADAAVDGAWHDVEFALKNHIATVSRLTHEGDKVLQDIDTSIQALEKTGGDRDGVDSLFGEHGVLIASASDPADSAMSGREIPRVPRFE